MTVFAIQNQRKMSGEGQLVSKFDMSSAKSFGTLVYLLSPTARPFHPENVIEELRDKLASYSDTDYLLLIGNPCLIGFAVSIASQVNRGRVAVLQWDGRKREYIPIHAILK